MNFLIGKWEEYRSGRAGIGQGFRILIFILESNYIYSNTKSVSDPGDTNPEGEVLEDWGIIRYDSFVDKFTMRDFHYERFINSYLLENIGKNPTQYEFNSYALENVLEGWTTRIALVNIDADTSEETLEPAQTGRDYVIYPENNVKESNKNHVLK